MSDPNPLGSHSDKGQGERLAAFSIRKPVTVCMLFLSILVLGAIAVFRVPLMLLPTLDAPVMFVFAEYDNATPDQVLESITKPLEEVLATIPGIQRMHSNSSSNFVSIRIWCGMSADTSILRANIREKIDRIRSELPEDLRQIDVRNFNTDEIPILEGTLTSNRDLRTSYDFLESKVLRPLERVPGVGNVELWGTDRKQIDIYLRLNDIKRYRVDVGELYSMIDGSNLNMSLGRISEGGYRYSAIAKGSLKSLDELKQFPVGAQNLVLSDVADVVFDQRPRNSGRHQNGTYAVGLSIQKTSEANTVDTVDAVSALFEQWADDPLMEGLTVRWWHNSGSEIRKALGELMEAGLIGALLAVMVLFLFLRRLDASLLIGMAIPFSVLTAIGLLYFNGGTLNTLSLMGLMLAAGMLVDNAVVVFESIFRKLEKGEPRVQAARQGAGEVAIAVIAATSTTMIIFVPLMFAEESQLAIMLSHVGISIIFALLCSLFISLTLIPLVVARFLKIEAGSQMILGQNLWDKVAGPMNSLWSRLRNRSGQATTRTSFMQRYLALVCWHLNRPYIVSLFIVPVILGASYWVLTEVVADNSPNDNIASTLRIEYEFSESFHYAKIEQDYVNPVEEFLHENQEKLKIQSTSSGYGNNSAWTRIYLEEDKVVPEDVGEIRKIINEGLPVIPGARIQLGQEGGSGRNWINANFYGDDPTILQELSREARRKLLLVDGISEVYTRAASAQQEVQVRLRRDIAQKYNISPSTVAQVLGITVRSQRMRGFHTTEGEIDVWIGIDPADMQNIEDLKSILVGGSSGGEPIQLGNVAEIEILPVPSVISRENRRTFSEIHIVYSGSKKEDGRKAVTEVLDDLPYEAGYGWSYGFHTTLENKDAQEFVFSMLLALVMVYFVMASLFESVLHPFAIMLSLPFSVVGIVIFLLATGTPFNIMAQIGLIILIGIVVNNGIVLINHVNNLRREGLPRRQAIMLGCEERMRPICMTALTTVVGLSPLAWGDGGLMGMSYFPLARTVMGGLMASTILTLIVLPTYYVVLDDIGRWFRQLWMASDPRKVPNPISGD